MKLIRSKSWYEKKAKLETNCSIAAGRFPGEILNSKVSRKPLSTSKPRPTTAAKVAFHKASRTK